MPNFICTTCGTQYAESAAPPQDCLICSDERQYIGWSGQTWTTLDRLRVDHNNRVFPEGPGLTGAWFRQNILEAGKQAVRYSVRRYLTAISDRSGDRI